MAKNKDPNEIGRGRGAGGETVRQYYASPKCTRAALPSPTRMDRMEWTPVRPRTLLAARVCVATCGEVERVLTMLELAFESQGFSLTTLMADPDRGGGAEEAMSPW